MCQLIAIWHPAVPCGTIWGAVLLQMQNPKKKKLDALQLACLLVNSW
jgi:hypothetical protein